MLQIFQSLRIQTVCHIKTRRFAASNFPLLPSLSLLMSLTFGLSVGLGGWSGAAQAALSTAEQATVSSYMQTFETQSPSNSDRADVLTDYFASSDDPYGTIQYLLSIGATFSEEMQFLIGNAIARYVEAEGLTNPQLSQDIALLMAAEPVQAVLSGYTEEVEILTSHVQRSRSANNTLLDRIKERLASPN
ncbi:MAG: hypothetical protein KUG61_07995 [Parvibaculaceae bacterium]|nr:hypothetical protein [Parvibaculaceae bacterium]